MITTLERQKKELADTMAKAQRLEVQIKETERRFTNKQAAIIDDLPKQLGVANQDAVISMIRARMKGQLGAIDPGTTGNRPPAGYGRRMNAEQKSKLDELILAGNMTGEEIAKAVPCSISTVGARRGWLKKNPPAPVPATAPVEPAPAVAG